MLFGITQDTVTVVNAVREQMLKDNAGQGLNDLQKSYTTALGLVGYNLEAPAKQLIPFMSPIRNVLPRINSGGGTAVNWKVITGVSASSGIGASEGVKSNGITTTLANKSATYKIWGLSDSVTIESIAASRNFQDAKALAHTNLLLRLMTEEEKMILGGITTTALGTVSAPTLSVASATTTITSATYSVKVAALNLIAANSIPLNSQVANLQLNCAVGVTAASTAATQAVTASNQSLTVSITPVTGAMAYAYFIGTSGSETLQVVSPNSQYTFTKLVTSGTAVASASTDTTADSLGIDGIIPQVISGGGYYLDAGYAKMTKSGAGVAEIDAMLSQMYSLYKTSPDKIWCGQQAFADITNAIVAGSGAPMYLVNGGDKANIIGGYMAASYINKFYNGMQIKLEVHPWLPPSTVVALTNTIPYPNANVPRAFEMEMAYDYMALEYAVTAPKYEFETRAFGVLKCYFPAACAVMTNFAPGIQ